MKGSNAQNLTMSGFSIPNLQVDNTSNVNLTGATRVSSSLTFTNGKIVLGANSFVLASTATFSGAGAGNF